ncbi:uncharacterized protein PG986_011412 [Apiospora aurea]|uniref:Helicase C-terminal domain-containing protein n=1 Tax=Apiospora aurea TaxID=335848 RepID=A0ABR1Q520_9PEZI
MADTEVSNSEGGNDAGTPVSELERLVASTEALKISAEALQKGAAASSREYSHVYLRIKGRNQDLHQYFEAWLGQFMGNNEGELPGGNVNWAALKSWVVTSINAAVGQRVRLGEIENTDLYALDPTEKVPRIAIDQWRLIILLIAWKRGEEVLQNHKGMPYIEFESTKLLRREGLLVIESIEVDTPPRPPGNRRVRKRTESTESPSGRPSKKRTKTETKTRTPNPNPGHGASEGKDNEEESEDDEEEKDKESNDGRSAGEEEEDYNRSPRETPITMEGADNRTRVLQEISSGDESRKLDDDANWKTARDVFLEEYSIVEHFSLPGLRRTIDCYQGAAAVWLLTRYSKQHIAGPILADDPGVGKTLTMIIAILLHNNLQEAFEDVKAFWKNNGRNNYEHNLEGADNEAPCPSQDKIKEVYGIQCPCVAGSTSRGIVDHMWNWPSIVVCLGQDGISNWLAEWKKTVDPQTYRVKVYVNVGNWDAGSNMSAFCRALRAATSPEETQTLHIRDVPFAKSILGFYGGSRHVLLSPSTGGKNLYEPERNVFVGYRKRGRSKKDTIAVPISGCAILALDEMHKYAGASGPKTMPYQVLDMLGGKDQEKPTLAVGISGSIGSLGLKYAQHLLAYTLRQGLRHQLGNRLGRLGNRDDTQKVISDWNYLQEHGAGDAKHEPAKYAEGLARLRHDWDQGISKMLVRRSQSDAFRNERIVRIPMPLYSTMALEVQPGPVREELYEHFRITRRAMLDYHRESLARLDEREKEQIEKKGKSTVKRPSLLDSQQRVLKGLAGFTTEEYTAVVRRVLFSTTFPGIALIAKQRPDLLPYLRSDQPQQGIAAAFTKATLNPEYTRQKVMQEVAKDNPFWDLAADSLPTTELLRDSPKAEELFRLINERLLGSRLDKKNPVVEQQLDAGPADGSGVRHMIIFVDSPITAYLLALILFRRFVEKIEVFLIHSKLPSSSASKSLDWHSRQAFEEAFNSDCQRTDRNKIAIVTYAMGSTGWNLQRASIAVLLDVPGTKAERDQACNRVNRRGQRCVPQIYEMYYTNHVREDRRILVNDNKPLRSVDWNKYGVNVKEEKQKEEKERKEKEDDPHIEDILDEDAMEI